MNEIVQSQFYKFHDNIKLNHLEDNKPLLEKREMLIKEIKDFLKKLSEEKKTQLITFDVFHQGSYSLGTGNKAAFDEDDYDIDIGLSFNLSKKDYPDCLVVKKWVFEALDKKQFRIVEFKRPCIRVQYIEDGQPKFHIDFAIYLDPKSNSDIMYIAKGKPGIPKDEIFWERSEPKKLLELINDKFSDVEVKDQFKRITRGYKRWKDLKFGDTVNGIPTGIAITALAYRGFKAKVKNEFNSAKEIDDLKAAYEFTKYILGEFWINTIKVNLPVPPENNLFERMTSDQMKNFKEKLEKLRDCLKEAIDEPDPHKACKILAKQFGDDFPIPPKEETAQNRKKPFVIGSESA